MRAEQFAILLAIEDNLLIPSIAATFYSGMIHDPFDWERSSAVNQSPCPSCGESTSLQDFVTLWDGRDYCVDCVEAESPRLLEQARNDTVLEETFTYSKTKLAFRWALMYGGTTASFVLTIILAGLLSQELTLYEAAKYWAIGFGFTLPLVALFTLASTWGYVLNRFSVSVTAGILTFTKWGKARSVALNQCEWYIGKVSHMTAAQNTIIVSDPALLIVLPQTADDRFAPSVAVGIETKSREIWEAFLTLSGIPQHAMWLKQWQIPTWWKAMALLLAMPVVFFGFMLFGVLVYALLIAFIPDQGLCLIVATVLFMCGGLSTVLYAVILGPWHTSSSRRVPTRRTRKEQREQLCKVFLMFFAISTGVFALPIALANNEFSVLARAAGIALSYAWVVFMTLHFGRYVTRYDWEYPLTYKTPKAKDD